MNSVPTILRRRHFPSIIDRNEQIKLFIAYVYYIVREVIPYYYFIRSTYNDMLNAKMIVKE